MPCNGCLFIAEVAYAPPTVSDPCRIPEAPLQPSQQWVRALDQFDYYSSLVYYRDSGWFQFNYQQEFSFYIPATGQFYFRAYTYDSDFLMSYP